MSLPTKYIKIVNEIFAGLKDQPENQTAEQVEICKRFIYLFHATFVCHDYDETKKLIHPNYKQHNVSVGDGPDSIVAFAQLLKRKQVDAVGKTALTEIHHKRLLVDGNFIAGQSHVVRWPGDRGENIFDIFRITDGLFSEHWDCVAEVPETLEHNNGVF